MKNRDIVIVGKQPWDVDIGCNCIDIAKEFAKYNRVLYVNEPLNRKTLYTKRTIPEIRYRIQILKGKSKALVEVSENIWVLNPRILLESINQIPSKKIHRFLNKRNSKLFAKEIQKAIENIHFKDFIIFNDSMMFLGQYLKEFLKPTHYIYYIRDNLITQPYFNIHGPQLEPELISKVDIVVANSVYLVNYAKNYNSNSFMIGQGCDTSLFRDSIDKHLIPDDMRLISRPIIGYVGALSSLRLDINLLIELAKNNKKWHFVFVGPEDEIFEKSELHEFDNAHFLGNKNIENLPYYIQQFDVCLNPQKVNKLTIGNYPRKVDEYLSMGKPVVATYTQAMQYFREFTYLCETAEQYVEAITLALKEDRESLRVKRIGFAKNHTWTNCVNNIYDIIVKNS